MDLSPTGQWPPTPDSDVWIVTETVEEAEHDGRTVTTRWSDGLSSRFHAIWLRDNCPCSECVHPSSKEQRYELCELPDNLYIEQASADDSGSLVVAWGSEPHASRFHPGWLRANDYSNPAAPRRERVTWTAAEMSEPPTYDGSAVMSSDEVFYELLLTLDPSRPTPISTTWRIRPGYRSLTASSARWTVATQSSSTAAAWARIFAAVTPSTSRC